MKLHALFEAAVTYLLVHHFGEENIESIFANLQMSDMKIGKIAFVNKLGLLDKDDISFIRLLSEIRNEYTHTLRNINAPLIDIVNNLPKDRLQIIAKRDSSIADHANNKVKDNLRLYLFSIAMTILPKLYTKKEDVRKKRDVAEKLRQIGEDFEREFSLSDDNLNANNQSSES